MPQYEIRGSIMKKKALCILLVAVLLAGMLCGCRRKREPKDEPVLDATMELIEATPGVRHSESADSLFDYDTYSKWTVTEFEGAYVIWEISEKVRPTGYTIVTGDDNETYTGRNPSTWTLYGSNGKSAPDRDSRKWELIDAVTDDEVLQDRNMVEYHYDILDVSEKYQYYMLVISETKGADVMQISQFALEYNGSNYVFPGSNGNAGGTGRPMTGSVTITDGGEYTIATDSYLTLYFARSPISSYYAYFWEMPEGDTDCLEMDPDGPTCRVDGLKPGTVTLKVTLEQSIQLGFSYDHRTDVYTIKIHVVDEDADPVRYDVTDGPCPRCHGHKKVSCMACYGKGCGGCDEGEVECTTCRGSGKWPK